MVRPALIGAIHHVLEVKWYLRLALLEWHRDAGEPLAENAREDLISDHPGTAFPGTADHHEVVSRRNELCDHLREVEVGQNMLPAPQQVDLDQVGIATENLGLLGLISIPIRPWAFVRGAEDFDECDELVAVQRVADFDEVVRNRIDDHCMLDRFRHITTGPIEHPDTTSSRPLRSPCLRLDHCKTRNNPVSRMAFLDNA
jgi:hypothetical protein